MGLVVMQLPNVKDLDDDSDLEVWQGLGARIE